MAANGAMNIAALLVAVLRNEKQIAGKTDIKKMIQEGKPLTTFPLESAKMKDFSDLAKQYGMMFSIVRDPNNSDTVDVIIKQEDAGIANQIREKIGATAEVSEKNADAGLSESESVKSEITNQHGPASTMTTPKLPQEQADSMLSRLDGIRAALASGAGLEQCRTQLHAIQDELGRALGMPERSQDKDAAQTQTATAEKRTPYREKHAARTDGKPSVRDRIASIKDRLAHEPQHLKQPQHTFQPPTGKHPMVK
ncbi:PcfB family protein [Agathobaculum sp. Marseille-P7918]|uniref:PcfB family protein n=1 Tax=Agathobaculum sp. Marseille-P7918 TaxID=2479843 RepID=UPI003568C7C4